MLRMLTRPTGVTRWIATTLVLAMTATLWPATAWASIGTSDLQEGPAPAFTPENPPIGGPGPKPRAGAGGIGIFSTVPSYDDSLDDGYLSRWDGKPTLFLSPNSDGRQDTVTLSWFEPFEGRPEIPGDPGDPDADPPIPPKDPVPAIPPGADTSVWLIVPPRQAGEAEQQMELMPVRRVGPGTVTFQWDGTIPGGWNVNDGWYYWYTKRTDPETGEETASALGPRQHHPLRVRSAR